MMYLKKKKLLAEIFKMGDMFSNDGAASCRVMIVRHLLHVLIFFYYINNIYVGEYFFVGAFLFLFSLLSMPAFVMKNITRRHPLLFRRQ